MRSWITHFLFMFCSLLGTATLAILIGSYITQTYGGIGIFLSILAIVCGVIAISFANDMAKVE